MNPWAKRIIGVMPSSSACTRTRRQRHVSAPPLRLAGALREAAVRLRELHLQQRSAEAREAAARGGMRLPIARCIRTYISDEYGHTF